MNNHPTSDPIKFWFWLLIVPTIVLGLIWLPLAFGPWAVAVLLITVFVVAAYNRWLPYT